MSDTRAMQLMRLVGEEMPIFRMNHTEGFRHIYMRPYKCKDITEDVLAAIIHNRTCHYMNYDCWPENINWKGLHNEGYTHIMIDGVHSTFSKFAPHRHYG